MSTQTLATAAAPLRILLVEDSPADARLIQTILRSPSFSVTTVDRLSDALDVLHTAEIDVILLDLNLPDSRGRETLYAVMEPANGTAIVVLTGHDDPQAALDAVALGAQDYLVKGSANAETIIRAIRYAFQRCRAEEDRRRAQERFQALVENSLDGIALVDAEGNIHYGSPAVERILGYPIDELIGTNVFTLMHPDDVDEARERLAAVVENRTLPQQTREVRYLRSDGQWRYLEVLRKNQLDHPAVRAIVINFRDVTERRLALDAAERQRRRYKVILNSVADGVYGVNTEGQITFENAASAAILGWDADDLIGKVAHQTIHYAHADGSTNQVGDCPIMATLRDGTVRRISDDLFWRRDGTSFKVEYEVAPRLDRQRQIVGVVVAFRDVTKQREMQYQVDQALRVSSLGSVSASVAHEFNNILMAIEPFVEILQRKFENDPSIRKPVRHIAEAVRRGRRVSNQILRFASPSVPRLTSLDLGAWLRDFTDEARLVLRDRRLEVGPTESLLMKADPEQLAQVMLNLVGNARDASSPGAAVTISAVRADNVPFLCERLAEPHHFAALLVRDRGSGIAPEVLDRIFQPLFTTKRSGGTGLGLAVVQQIVTEHGGQIVVDSEAGTGSTFYIALPLERPEFAPPEGGGEC